MTDRELWSAARIAEEFGWSGGAATARKWLHRHRIKHEATAGPRDTRLYDPETVRAVREKAPGWGARTDLQAKGGRR